MTIRVATEADVSTLAALYEAAARAAGPAIFSPEQVETWAAFARTRPFRAFILDPHTFVAEDAEGPLGFAGLEDDGHVRSLYVHPRAMRRGIGSALLGDVLALADERGLGRLYAEANPFSRPLFERFGFRTLRTETVVRGRVRFTLFAVERQAPFTEPTASA